MPRTRYVAHVDNTDLKPKLELRRYFMEKYHTEKRPRVIDCCMGEGKLWSNLRQEYPLESYWGLDMKRAKGRIKLDSRRLLDMPGWQADVVDVDTYGTPWDHWLGILANGVPPLTVFLTVGVVRNAGTGISKAELKAIGLDTLTHLPSSLATRLVPMAQAQMLRLGTRGGWRITEAMEVVQDNWHMRYIGVRLDAA